jgi:hypothetical protein
MGDARGDCGERQMTMAFGRVPNSNSRWRVSDPLPPAAALPLTEGENKVISPL